MEYYVRTCRCPLRLINDNLNSEGFKVASLISSVQGVTLPDLHNPGFRSRLQASRTNTERSLHVILNRTILKRMSLRRIADSRCSALPDKALPQESRRNEQVISADVQIRYENLIRGGQYARAFAHAIPREISLDVRGIMPGAYPRR